MYFFPIHFAAKTVVWNYEVENDPLLSFISYSFQGRIPLWVEREWCFGCLSIWIVHIVCQNLKWKLLGIPFGDCKLLFGVCLLYDSKDLSHSKSRRKSHYSSKFYFQLFDFSSLKIINQRINHLINIKKWLTIKCFYIEHPLLEIVIAFLYIPQL